MNMTVIDLDCFEAAERAEIERSRREWSDGVPPCERFARALAGQFDHQDPDVIASVRRVERIAADSRDLERAEAERLKGTQNLA